MLRFLIAAFLVFTSITPALADYTAGKKAYDRGDWIGAIRNLRPVGEAGDGRALLLLGHMYLNGKGVIKNEQEAIDLYVRAAEAGNTPAMVAYAAMTEAGLGKDADALLAQAWYEHAALLGDHAGAFWNSVLLFKGDMSKKTPMIPNKFEAYKWVLIAQKNKYYPKVSDAADALVPKFAGRLTRAQRTRAEKSSRKFQTTKS